MRVPLLHGTCLGFVLLAAVAWPFRVFAQDEDRGATYARVRYLEGGLTLERAAQGEAVDGSLNSPIASGDAVWTRGGRAEIQLADGAVVWMDDGTRVEFRTLADADNQYEKTDLLAVQNGTIRVEAGRAGDADGAFQVDTQAGSVYLLSAGSFRIEVDGDATTLASYGGLAEFSGDGGSVLVRTAQRSRVASGDAPEEPRRFNTGRTDEFDQFHDRRDSAYLESGGGTSEPPQEVPEEVAPYVRELSSYGTWSTLPTYGVVWRPSYVGNWTPYFHGYWDWYPTGWVWVSYDPWGWAPYRYGRWDYASSFGWFWIPGRVWSGAWVSYAVGPSYIGWCPLNYFNQPVLHDPSVAAQETVPVARLDARAWQFVPAARFGARGAIAAVTRLDRLPRNSEVVVTRSLPSAGRLSTLGRSDSALIDDARRHRVVLPESRTAAGDPVSFRTLEIRPKPAARPNPSQRVALPGIRTRPPVQAIPDPTRPAPVSVRPPAVGRLIQGARPASAPATASAASTVEAPPGAGPAGRKPQVVNKPAPGPADHPAGKDPPSR